MDKCIDYLEQLSAYVDGELTESDKKRVEEHLETCENCSAILGLYREMSVAADEWGAPAPEALCVGVMEKVLNGDADSAADAAKAKRKKTVRIALTRYLPVAACLALVLLTLPRITSYNNRQTNEFLGSSGAAPEMFMVAPAPSAAMQDSILESGNDGMEVARGGGSGDAFESPEIQPMAPGGGAMPLPEESSATDDVGIGDAREPSLAPPAAAPAPVPTPIPAEDRPLSEPTEDVAQGSPPLEDYDSESPPLEDYVSEVPALMENWNTPGDYSDVYAWIEITGDLPELLVAYSPEPLSGWLNWEVCYRIPRAAAQELIDEIRARDGIDIPIINEDSDYALVLYARAD